MTPLCVLCFILNLNYTLLHLRLSKALYHTFFVAEQRCKWSRQPKLTLSAISDVKFIIYILHLQ